MGEDGLPFFFNPATQESAWELPPGAVMLEGDFVADGAAMVLAHGWEELWDDAGQCAFYYHAASGETVWEAPMEAAGGGASVDEDAEWRKEVLSLSAPEKRAKCVSLA